MEEKRLMHGPSEIDNILEHQHIYSNIKQENNRLILQKRDEERRKQKAHFESLHYKPRVNALEDERLRKMVEKKLIMDEGR